MLCHFVIFSKKSSLVLMLFYLGSIIIYKLFALHSLTQNIYPKRAFIDRLFSLRMAHAACVVSRHFVEYCAVGPRMASGIKGCHDVSAHIRFGSLCCADVTVM